ncbi:MAG: proton-conducting transporter membrane subunit [Limisphaerales bacterium]
MNWTIAPILIPILTALLCLMWSRPSRSRQVFAGVSAGIQLIIAIFLVNRTYTGDPFVMGLGNWPSQLGIILVVDLLAAIMIALSSLIALATLVYGFIEIGPRIEHPLRVPLVQFLVAGINLSFATGDLFNLFVGFEVMLIASYSLLTLEADDWDVKHAFPYVAINLVGSTFFICGAGMAYAMFGTLNFAEISARAAEMSNDPRVLALGLLFMVIFGIKAGLFPLYFWLPNSYPTLPVPLAALYAGMLTKVGVYVLLRFFGTVMPHDLHLIHKILAWLAGFTMLLAVIGAISRNFVRGILSFHILSQIGFMVLAIGFFTPLSIAACIFYIVHHIIVKSSLFLIGGVALCYNRSDNLDRMGNLWRDVPFLGILFLCQALSLAGLPPLSGFWGKYLIIVAGMEQHAYVLVAFSILASVFTLFSMLKIWNGAFWHTSDQVEVRLQDRRAKPMTTVIAVLAAISLFVGFGAELFYSIAKKAGEQTLNQKAYIELVRGYQGKGASK